MGIATNMQTAVVTPTDKPVMVIFDIPDSSFDLTTWFSVNVFIKVLISVRVELSVVHVDSSGNAHVILGKLFIS